MPICDACGQRNPDQARFCDYCGQSLQVVIPASVEEVKKPVGEESSGHGLALDDEIQKQIEEEERIRAAARAKAEETEKVKEQEKKRQDNKDALKGLAVLGLFLIFGFWICSGPKNNPHPGTTSQASVPDAWRTPTEERFDALTGTEPPETILEVVDGFLRGVVPYSVTIPKMREGAAKVARLIRPLAEQGNAEAQYLLGQLYGSKERGLENNLTEEQRWYQRAATHGHIRAMVVLGDLALWGWSSLSLRRSGDERLPLTDMQQQHRSAYYWYHLAATQPVTTETADRVGEAAAMVGALYIDGFARPRSDEAAIAWWQKSGAVRRWSRLHPDAGKQLTRTRNVQSPDDAAQLDFYHVSFALGRLVFDQLDNNKYNHKYGRAFPYDPAQASQWCSVVANSTWGKDVLGCRVWIRIVLESERSFPGTLHPPSFNIQISTGRETAERIWIPRFEQAFTAVEQMNADETMSRLETRGEIEMPSAALPDHNVGTPPATESSLDAEYERVRQQDTVKAYQDFLYQHHSNEKHYAEALARLDELLHPNGQPDHDVGTP